MKTYCTYRTTHPSGFVYEGKGITARVLGGKYKGSGTRFKLALTVPGFEWDTWTTVVLEQFDNEEAAYEAEALLVPIEKLRNPFQLNNQAGGRSGRNHNHSALVRRDTAAEKRKAREAATQRRKLKEAETKQKIKDLKARLKK
jgi:hypothetical protein